MTPLPLFERLAESVDLIAHHPDCPGKFQIVEQCAEEIEDRLRSGQITEWQERFLLDMLRGGSRRRTA